MMDALDQARIERLVQINSQPGNRCPRRSLRPGMGYGRACRGIRGARIPAPFVIVQRKSDREKGSLEFQHCPRFYFNFVLDKP